MPGPRHDGRISAPVKRALGWALAGCLALPLGLDVLLKTDLQPGLHDDAVRAAWLVDAQMAGLAMSLVSVWLTVAIGCWIVATLLGPERRADAFPADDAEANEAPHAAPPALLKSPTDEP